MQTIRQQISATACQYTGRRVGPAEWWQYYDEAVAFKAENGDTKFPGKSKLYLWALSTREAWNNNGLEPEQAMALRELGFERAPSHGGGPPRTGKFIDELRALRERVDAGEATADDEAEYQKGILHLHRRLNAGQLSPRTAAEFGIG